MNQTPVGTVIHSFLTWEQFSKHVGIGNWDARSKWAPCDGRDVKLSSYHNITDRGTVPDLRGIFLRGLNTIDPGYPPLPNDAPQRDPNERSVGFYQNDEVGPHTHPITLGEHLFAYKASGMGIQSNAGQQVQFSKPSIVIDKPTGKETRPKNISVYYYMRIN